MRGEAAERAPPSQLLKYYCFLKAKDSVPRQGQLRSFMVSPCPVVIQVTGEHGVGRKGRGALAGWESVGSWDLPTPAPRGVWGQWKGMCVLTVFGLPSWRAWKLESGAPPPAVSSPSRLEKPETGGTGRIEGFEQPFLQAQCVAHRGGGRGGSATACAPRPPAGVRPSHAQGSGALSQCFCGPRAELAGLAHFLIEVTVIFMSALEGCVETKQPKINMILMPRRLAGGRRRQPLT